MASKQAKSIEHTSLMWIAGSCLLMHLKQDTAHEAHLSKKHAAGQA